jgi:repressor LexA
MVSIPVIGQIAAGQPIPVPESLGEFDVSSMIELSPDLAPNNGRSLFALRVKGHSMVDALINDGDIVVLKAQETCENGETVAVWLRDERETTLKRFYLEDGNRVRLQPANVTMDPIYTDASNVEVQGKLVSVVRAIM